MPETPKLKWRLLSFLMRTVGQASHGIWLGYRFGFDSGEMLDYVYENRAHGRYMYGTMVDRVYLDSIGWRAIRARKALLQATLRSIIAARSAASKRTVLVDIASGPGRYLLELDRELGQPEDLEILCRDLDEVGLEQGRRQARQWGLKNVRFEPGDACDPESLRRIDPQPNVAAASGLYELLVDPTPIGQSMEGVFDALDDGGQIVFTTQVSHPQLELIANVLPNRFGQPWVMICRSVAEVEDLARDTGFCDLNTELEPFGLFAVTVGVK